MESVHTHEADLARAYMRIDVPSVGETLVPREVRLLLPGNKCADAPQHDAMVEQLVAAAWGLA